MHFAERGGDFLNHPSFKRVKKRMRKSLGKKMDLKDFFVGDKDGGGPSPSVMDVDNMSIREILRKSLGERPCLQKNLGWWTYEFCYGEYVRQYHANAFIDSNTGFTKTNNRDGTSSWTVSQQRQRRQRLPGRGRTLACSQCYGIQ
mmetsp:Transcript_4342/g.8361  ORF Transcript_4342/g.8361 Transcript_4342/m.8361 type:complete len:145 (-) Transcript_4342:539-973(-)